MKPIKKNFTNLGNSVGVVVDRILLRESGLKETDDIELTCGKDRVTIRKAKEQKEKEN
jgi:antitoxin component of MazEF toxin-antitoxin module